MLESEWITRSEKGEVMAASCASGGDEVNLFLRSTCVWKVCELWSSVKKISFGSDCFGDFFSNVGEQVCSIITYLIDIPYRPNRLQSCNTTKVLYLWQSRCVN